MYVSSPFCQNFSETTSVLRELLKPENEFCWNAEHQEAFEKLKRMLTSAPVLQYFNPKLEIKIQCDSSQSGLGAVIKQGEKVVEYASRAL